MAMSRVFSYHVRSGSSAEPMIVERETVRAILLTNANEVLLFRTHVPDKSEYFWVTPGGGLEPGETPEQGLRRQLREELSLDEFVMGPSSGGDSSIGPANVSASVSDAMSFESIALNRIRPMMKERLWVSFAGGRPQSWRPRASV
jgi:8-oxo-dGTP pyrophosphatase MutT (NUDIX family)